MFLFLGLPSSMRSFSFPERTSHSSSHNISYFFCFLVCHFVFQVRRIRICNTDEIYFLEFNSNLLTFLQVEESPLKDEIQSGSIVVGEAAPAQAQHRPSKGARKRKSWINWRTSVPFYGSLLSTCLLNFDYTLGIKYTFVVLTKYRTQKFRNCQLWYLVS